MTKTAASNVVVSADSKVRLGKKTFTQAELDAHGAALVDKLDLLRQETLHVSREIGLVLIQIQTLFGGNKKGFGQYLQKKYPLICEAMPSYQNRNDCMKIAENWNKIQRMNTKGEINHLGPSAVMKRLRKAEKPASAGNVSKGKKAQTKDQAKPEAMTEVELAIEVAAKLETYGLDFKKFAEALAMARKKA